MSVRIRPIVIVCVVAGLAAAAWQDARGEVTRKELTKLFDLGWQPGADAPAEAEAYYEDLARSSKFDPRVKYAYVLVRIKQRKYPDALKLVSDVVSSEPRNAYAWRTKVWLEVLTKDYSQALLSLDKLSELIPSEDHPDPDKERVIRDVVTLCGRVFGYLDGPVANATNEALRTSHRKKFLGRLTESRQTAFDEGRDAVTEKFLELTDEKLATKEKAQDNAEEDREQKLKDLEAEKQAAAKRESDLNQRREKLKTELKTELDDLAKKDRPLQAEFNRLDARGTVIRNELALITNDIARVQALADREKDPLIRSRYLSEIDRLSIIGARYDADFAVIRRNAAAVAAQRATLQQQGAQAQARIGGQINGVDKEINDLGKKTRRVAGQEKRVKGQTVTGETPEVRAKSAQAGAFVTYEPFALEQERERLLDAIK